MAKAKPQPDVDDRSQAQKQADDEATEFLGEEVRNGQVVNVPEEVAEPEAEAQPEPEAPKQEEQLPPPPPAIDPEKLKEELRAEVSQEIVNKLKPQEPEAVDPDDIAPWEKEGRQPKDWKEVARFASAQAKKELNAEIEEDNRVAAEQQRQVQEAQAQYIAEINASWDEDFAELRAAGKLPAIVDPNDQNDPGKQAQIAVLQQMLETNQQRTAQGKKAIMSVAAFHNLYYKDPRQQPPGANAPVSLSRKSVSQPDPNQYSYQDIHNARWEDLEAQLKNS